MAIGLNEATDILTDSVLHIGNDTFTAEKKHRAIKGACLRFLRATNCDVGTLDITVASSAQTLDLTDTAINGLATFTEWQWIDAEIDYYPVAKTTWQDIVRRWESGTPTAGRPTRIASRGPDNWRFDKPADAGYTMKLHYRKTLVSFTPGSGSNPTLNIPDEWLYDVIWFGARGFLLKGAPGHPDAQPAMDEFNALIARAQRAFGGTQSGVEDRQTAD